MQWDNRQLPLCSAANLILTWSISKSCKSEVVAMVGRKNYLTWPQSNHQSQHQGLYVCIVSDGIIRKTWIAPPSLCPTDIVTVTRDGTQTGPHWPHQGSPFLSCAVGIYMCLLRSVLFAVLLHVLAIFMVARDGDLQLLTPGHSLAASCIELWVSQKAELQGQREQVSRLHMAHDCDSSASEPSSGPSNSF